MTDQLPEVGSVWRDAETGMIRVIHSHSEDGQLVYFYKPGIDRRCNATADEWGYMQTFFTRLDAAPPPLTLEEAEHIANIFAAYPIDRSEDVKLAIRKQAEWLRDYINGRGRHE